MNNPTNWANHDALNRTCTLKSRAELQAHIDKINNKTKKK